ncbi:PH domain-containing protein [Demequina sediminicola]|uniref:PH domain-containing protein n=1 Tax=Demequina sediminicola TaxID=1095026 RepID=UPI000781580B|nr:PH domain-containing protein [Demequina sediminicola]
MTQGNAPVVYRAPREWTRLHPVSPLLGGWAVFGVVVSIALYNYAPSWTGVDPALQEGAHFLMRSILWVIVGAVVVIGLAIGFGYLQWHYSEYRLSSVAVEQRKGVLFKQHKQARLDRVQAVDVVQPLIARIFRFASLKIEVAGGESSTIALEYLRLGDAEAMRNELLALSAGVKRAKASGGEATVDAVVSDLGGAPHVDGAEPMPATAGLGADSVGDSVAGERHDAGPGSLRDLAGAPAGYAATPASPQREVYRVRTSDLLMSILLSWPFVWLVTIPVVAVAAVLVMNLDVSRILAVAGASLVTIVPVALALFGFFWNELSRGYGFVAGLSEDGIHLRHGLTETRRQTVPAGRVQAIEFQQPLLWRRRDWWRITINVAGYQDDAQAVSTLLPVGTRQDALTALWLVLPDLGDPDPAGTVSQALSGQGAEGGFTAASSRSKVFDPWQWRQRGVRATEHALLIRRGRFVRHMYVVPHERTQSLGLTQGPLQRARGLADVAVHSTNGPVKPVARHLDEADARELLIAQAQRAAHERQAQTAEQWKGAVGLDG